jgi:hypothetical protein
VSVQSFENHFSVIAQSITEAWPSPKNTNNFWTLDAPHNQLIEISHTKFPWKKTYIKYRGKSMEKKSSPKWQHETFSIKLSWNTQSKRENTSYLFTTMCVIQVFTNDSVTNCVGHHFWPRLMARAWIVGVGGHRTRRVQTSEMTNGTKWVIKYGAQALWYHSIEKLHQLLHFIAHFTKVTFGFTFIAMESINPCCLLSIHLHCS